MHSGSDQVNRVRDDPHTPVKNAQAGFVQQPATMKDDVLHSKEEYNEHDEERDVEAVQSPANGR
jgi:hypothetical protein